MHTQTMKTFAEGIAALGHHNVKTLDIKVVALTADVMQPDRTIARVIRIDSVIVPRLRRGHGNFTNFLYYLCNIALSYNMQIEFGMVINPALEGKLAKLGFIRYSNSCYRSDGKEQLLAAGFRIASAIRSR